MRAIQLCKTVLVASVALLFTLFALGNLTDYGSNWSFVQHVLAMDTIFPDSSLHWRAVTNPALQTAAFWLIIAWQCVTAVTLWVGATRLFFATRKDFAGAKPVAVVGLTAGMVLYLVGFIAIGGEWFAMWQSETWNGQASAFRFLALTGIVLAILLAPEVEERPYR